MAHKPITVSANSGGQDFELVPEGTHFAICTLIAYIGVQKTVFNDTVKEQPKVHFRFEVPEIEIEYEKNGKTVKGPAIIGRTFTLNIGSKSNLGPFIENWRGKAFTEAEAAEYDVTSLLGKVCMLSVIHEENKGKTYANISGAGKISKLYQSALENGTLSAEPHGELISYNADDPDEATFRKLPKFLQKKIDERIVHGETARKDKDPTRGTQTNPEEDFDDDIPF